MVILFSLMSYGQYGDCFFVLDFKECNIPTVAKRNEHLPEKGIVRGALSTGKWKIFKEPHCLSNGNLGVMCRLNIPFKKESEKPFDIFFGFPCIANLVAQLFSALASMESRPASTSSAL